MPYQTIQYTRHVKCPVGNDNLYPCTFSNEISERMKREGEREKKDVEMWFYGS